MSSAYLNIECFGWSVAKSLIWLANLFLNVSQIKDLAGLDSSVFLIVCGIVALIIYRVSGFSSFSFKIKIL